MSARRRERREVKPFTLATQDLPERLEIPERLYGRGKEIAQLLSAFERVRAGATELLLVGGFAGVGKTALIRETRAAIVGGGGRFIEGKYDQLERSVPCAALIQAFRELMGQVLTEDETSVAAWKSRLLDALGPNGQVVMDMIPELAWIIGPQPPVPALGSTEAQNRFNLYFQRFIGVFAREGRPLALFLDDLQWADSASLDLITTLMAGAGSEGLLILGAYRDNEVPAHHPLRKLLTSLRGQGATLSELGLEPLRSEDVVSMLADALRVAEAAAAPLAVLLLAKTQGNPFFLRMFLGYAQILKRDEGLTEAQRSGMDIIERSGEHLLTLITDLLDLSKIEAGRLEAQAVDFHLPEFLRGLADIARIRAEQKGIVFHFEAPSPLPDLVRGDDRRLRQVLLNLLGNAVKFTEVGSVSLRAAASPAGPGLAHLCFEVEDTGVGIAEPDLEAIFRPFQQVGPRSGHVEGTGLGLTISRRLVRLMGGELFVQSSPGRGSTFRVELEQRVAERTLELERALAEVARLKDRLQAENRYLQDEIRLSHNFGEIVGASPALTKVLRHVEQVAATGANVLILGETGTGKELIARAVHALSPRKGRPLVKVNCAALPANLIESELFGHEKGAFTGAVQRRTGRFELADGGTIFLDEVGDLPHELQAKLLRVLQEGEFERVGSAHTIKVDARVLAATNRDLREAVAKGEFREDLYYRLHVFPIALPPLRQRREDIALLVRHFVAKYAKKLGRATVSVPPRAMERLQGYAWPGNIRELENVIERALILSPGPVLELDEMLEVRGATASAKTTCLTLEDAERSHVRAILEETAWQIEGPGGAAKRFAINPSTLRSRMRKLGIERPRAVGSGKAPPADG